MNLSEWFSPPTVGAAEHRQACLRAAVDSDADQLFHLHRLGDPCNTRCEIITPAGGSRSPRTLLSPALTAALEANRRGPDGS